MTLTPEIRLNEISAILSRGVLRAIDANSQTLKINDTAVDNENDKFTVPNIKPRRRKRLIPAKNYKNTQEIKYAGNSS
jgi:hypothetical protein